MDPGSLTRLLGRSAALKLLRSEQAPFVLALGDETFRQKGRSEVGESELTERLAALLEREGVAKGTEADAQARRWITTWCDEDHRWMRRFWVRGQDEQNVQLRPDVERALRWVDELTPREFVGTESRFEQIVALLRQLAGRTTADPQRRIEELSKERDALQEEIDRIRQGGEVEVYTEVQVRERLQGVRDGAGSLLSDFREVEERFREIGREVQERRLEGMLSKGGIVGGLLEADDELRESAQGQSFEAFHRLLLAPDGQDEMLALVERVTHLPEVERDTDATRWMMELLDRFLGSAERIEGAVRSMAGQIRRVLDERRSGEDRRARELVDEIRRLALGIRQSSKLDIFHEIGGAPELGLPLERPLWQASVQVTFEDEPVDLAQADAEERIDALFQRIPVDLSQLRETLESALADRGDISLDDLLRVHPVELGLAELVGWLKVCAQWPNLEKGDGTDELLIHDRLAGSQTKVRIPHWKMTSSPTTPSMIQTISVNKKGEP